MAVADSIFRRRIGHWTVLRCTAEPSTLLCRCVCGRVCAVSSLNLCRWQGKWGCGCRNSRYQNTGPPPNLITPLPPVGRHFGCFPPSMGSDSPFHRRIAQFRPFIVAPVLDRQAFNRRFERGYME
jgi:hypothetical protein